LHPDGTPAEDNIEGHVYSIGHRNVYGLAYDPATERLFATENNNAERDEVNLITAGGNYGWPICEGTVRYDFDRVEPTDEPCDDPDITLPIGEFYPDGTVAPTGAIILHGHLYWASWNHGEIHRMVEDRNGDWHDQIVYKPGHRINDLETDGEAVYYSDWTTIYRLEVPEPPQDLASTISPEGEVGGDGEDGPETPSALPGPALIVTLVALVFLASRYRPRR
ncbi:MAG: PQQ-dependent sugar dehydrogenase, partial [Euryarchaeota archaeon]|nr:PQQ-dependent sugar dehydrogenase [Euryarchaeota archaeon]